jgi:hypothetical protein
MGYVSLSLVFVAPILIGIADFPHISAALSLNFAWADRRSERFVSSRMDADARSEPNPATPCSDLG